MKNKVWLFGSGGAFYAAVTSLHQDYLGLEAYLDVVCENWVSSSLSVPLALSFGALSLFIYFTTD